MAQVRVYTYLVWFITIYVVGVKIVKAFPQDINNYKDNLSELKLIHAIFRHGDRTPEPAELALFPNNPHINDTFLPYGLKALTNTGKARAYQIGVFLRDRYKSFLSSDFKAEEIYVRSTDFERTKMSAMACLAGLFNKNKDILKDNTKLLGQPIPLDMKPLLDDDMISYWNCPNYIKAKDIQLSSPKFEGILAPYKSFFQEISKNVGRDITTPFQVFFLDNLFQAEENYGLEIPDWAERLMPKIKKLTKIDYSLQMSTDELIRLSGGTLLQKIIADSELKIKKSQPKEEERKLFVYSGHEVNVAAMLAGVDLFKKDVHQPPYGSTVIFELHQMCRTKQYTVKTLYLRDVYSSPKVMTIPGCEQYCPFERFVELTKNTVTNTFKDIC